MRLLFVALLLTAAACHEGHSGLEAGDLATVDLMPAPDLEPPPDLLPPPNCGKIVFCAIGCIGGGGLGGIGGGGSSVDAGGNPLGCVLGCGQNAPSTEVTAALSLVGCAAINCLASDGGTSGQLGILTCMQMKCPSQIAACSGLGIGG